MSRNRTEHYRIYGSPERQAWFRTLGCLICGQSPEIAHVTNGGMGRKADARYTVPLCTSHHAEQHQQGVKSFEQAYGVDLKASAEWVESQWRQHSDSSGAIDG